MNRFALLQAPATDETVWSPQIKAVNNSTHIGKKKVQSMVNNGWVFVGWLEPADDKLTSRYFERGFSAAERDRADRYRELLDDIGAKASSIY